jgi:type III secretion system chaperone SycN
MHWVDEALGQFCENQGVSVPAPVADLIQLEFEGWTLHLERHACCLTLWIALELPWHMHYQALNRALVLVYSRTGPGLPLRCGWVRDNALLLFITLGERRVTVPVLEEALRTLSRAREAVLAP